MSDKKFIMVGTPLSSETHLMTISPEDEGKTVKQILVELAEQLEQKSSRSLEARQITERINSDSFFVNDTEIAKDTLISDLNFELDVTPNGNALLCDLTLREQHAGG